MVVISSKVLIISYIALSHVLLKIDISTVLTHTMISNLLIAVYIGILIINMVSNITGCIIVLKKWFLFTILWQVVHSL